MKCRIIIYQKNLTFFKCVKMKIKLEIYGNNRLKSKYKLYTVDYNVIIIYYPYIFIYSIQRENRLE